MTEILQKISYESPWTAIGETLARLEEKGSADAQGVPWAQHVLNRLDEVGRPIAAQQLRKIRRCYIFLKNEAQVDPADYSHCSLSGVEVVAKIFAIDPAKGQEQLKELKRGLQYIVLLRRYEALRGGPGQAAANFRTAARRNRGHPKERHENVEKKVIQWIEDEPTLFFGDEVSGALLKKESHYSFKNYPKSDFGKADLVFIVKYLYREKSNRYIGIDIKIMGMADPRQSRSVVAHVAVTSSFYDLFWLVLADIRDGTSIAAEVENLGLANVGVAVFSLEGKSEIIKRPTGMPFPDRRALMSIR